MGLVTRDKFLHMKNTIQERREEEAAQAKRQADQQQEQVSPCPRQNNLHLQKHLQRHASLDCWKHYRGTQASSADSLKTGFGTLRQS